MKHKAPRGIRNNNPGNIDRTNERWQGMSADQSADERFVVFDSAEWGIRALTKVLRNYGLRHDINSVRGVIERWAPSVENNTEAYINQVASALGVNPDQIIDLQDPDTLQPLVTAIIKHENGQQPYTAELIRKGVERAFA